MVTDRECLDIGRMDQDTLRVVCHDLTSPLGTLSSTPRSQPQLRHAARTDHTRVLAASSAPASTRQQRGTTQTPTTAIRWPSPLIMGGDPSSHTPARFTHPVAVYIRPAGVRAEC